MIKENSEVFGSGENRNRFTINRDIGRKLSPRSQAESAGKALRWVKHQAMLSRPIRDIINSRLSGEGFGEAITG